MIYRLHEDDNLSIEMVKKYLTKNQEEYARRSKLFDYYNGNHGIKARTSVDASKPNNKVINPYARYITTLMTGYFIGEPITYRSVNAELEEIIRGINNYNDESSNNTELAKNASICGVAYELLYIDTDGEIRFKAIDPKNAIAIYDTNIDSEMLYFIRSYTDYNIIEEKNIEYIEIYSRNDYRLYKHDLGSYALVEQHEHSFGCVPIVEYKNNAEQLGDFELVVSLIDAYDNLISDSLNDADYFSDAYLALYGMLGTTPEDVAAMKENRVLLMDTDSKAEWLTKSISDAAQEDIKNRIDRDIHKFSLCPAMTDESFAQNASGVALKYKLMGLENATANKESYFKRGIQRRLEIICGYLAMLGRAFNYREIEVVFTRNIPNNIVEVADVINKVGHLLSEETQLSMLPLEIDYAAEQERKKSERENGYDDFDFGSVMND